VRATARPITERTGVGTRSLGSANTSRSIHHGTRVGTAANGNGNNGELQREHNAEPNDDDEVKRLASRQAYNGLGLRMAVLGLVRSRSGGVAANCESNALIQRAVGEFS
jgi:hypothetical protein